MELASTDLAGLWSIFLTDQPRVAVRRRSPGCGKHYCAPMWSARIFRTIGASVPASREPRATHDARRTHGDYTARCLLGEPARCHPTTLRNTFYTRNPTLKNFDRGMGRLDHVHNGKTAVRAVLGYFDVLPQPYINPTLYPTTAPFLGPTVQFGPPGSKTPPQGDFQ